MQEQPTPPQNTLYERKTRSRRRLTATRQFLYRLGAPVGMAVVRLCWATLRDLRVLGHGRLAAALAEHGAVIPVYWHQHQLLPIRYLLQHHDAGLKLGFLVSPSVDGEMPALMAHRAGAYAVRGSSSATGARALRDYYDAIKQGISPAITPDGPHGPARVFKPGAILVSQLSGKPIVPMAFAARRAYVFRTWDQFVLPWPFTRLVLAVGEPRIVPRSLDAAALERWQATMGEELGALYRTARDALSQPELGDRI